MAPYRWFEHNTLTEYIERKTSVISRDFPLVFVSFSTREVDTGYVDYGRKLCYVNPDLFGKSAEESNFISTFYMSCHERAHVRYTTNWSMEDFAKRDSKGSIITNKAGKTQYDMLLKTVVNILEDERIERRLEREFPALRPIMKSGAGVMTKMVSSVKDVQTSTQRILQTILLRRLYERAGLRFEITLSPEELLVFEKVDPLVQQSFGFSTTQGVITLSRQVCQILRENFPSDPETSDLLDEMSEVSDYEESDDSTFEDHEDVEGPEKDIKDVLEESGFSEYIKSSRNVPLKSYAELLREVEPIVAPFRECFHLLKTKTFRTPQESGRRLSFREFIRNPLTPFVEESPSNRDLPIAMSLVIDDSGSMTGESELTSKKIALLFAEAFKDRHKLRVVLSPSNTLLLNTLDQDGFEYAKVAGYRSESGTLYHKVLEQELSILKATRATNKYIILIADGVSNDVSKVRDIVNRCRKLGIRPIAFGINLGNEGELYFKKSFQDSFISVKGVDSLLKQSEQLLARIANHNRTKLYG